MVAKLFHTITVKNKACPGHFYGTLFGSANGHYQGMLLGDRLESTFRETNNFEKKFIILIINFNFLTKGIN